LSAIWTEVFWLHPNEPSQYPWLAGQVNPGKNDSVGCELTTAVSGVMWRPKVGEPAAGE